MSTGTGTWKRIGLLAVSVVFLTAGITPVMAETVLKNIRVSASYPDWEDGMARIPGFSVSGGCDIEVEWLSSQFSFSPGKTVRAAITITPAAGYVFDHTTSLTVNGADISSKSFSEHEIRAQVKAGPLYYKLAAPEHVSWKAETSPIVTWSKVDYATGYRVKVYQDDRVVKQEIIKSRSYDVGKYFNGDSQVMVSVTAVDQESSNRSYIRESREAFADGDDVDWDDRETTYGVWQGNRYLVSANGAAQEYARGWTEIFGRWYYFNQSGILQTGWIQDGDRRYYADKDGVMQVGWVKPDGGGHWYYMDSSGGMMTGWVTGEPGAWYYLNQDGTMYIGWLANEGRQYFLGAGGKMLTAWQQINGHWYYFHPDGRMALNESIGTCYVGADGVWRG